MKLFSPALLALLPAALLLAACAQTHEAPTAVPLPSADGLLARQVLFPDGTGKRVACYRIPALTTAPDGTLLAAIDERVPSCADLRGNRDINIVLRRSIDQGQTWTNVQTVVDFPEGQSGSDPSFVVDKVTGEVFLFYNFMDLERAKDVYRLHVVRSRDNGRSWSAPEDLTSQITRPGWEKDFQFITSGRGIQTRSGRLLHTLVNLDKGLHLFGSDDHGTSWFLIETPITPGDESKVVELNDGSYMVNSRVNKAGTRWVHVSKDEGKTWASRPEPALPDPGVNGSIARYSSTGDGAARDRLLFANPASASKRENLTVRLSYDEGQTWSAARVVYAGEAAYPSMAVLDDGTVGLFFEQDDYTRNTFVRFTLGWLTGGQDEGKE